VSLPQNADRYLTRRWPYGQAALVYYVRPGGDDDNNGLTPAAAFATLDRALHFMAIAEVNESVVIDITGMVIDQDVVLNIGGTTLGGLDFDLDLGAASPDNFFSRAHRQIRAEPQLVQALVVTGQAFDPISTILTLTVANALVANALRGRFAIGAVLGEYGVIQSNTGGPGPNTIEVANVVGVPMTLPVGAYGTGATLRYGDPANFFEQSIYLNALCDWNLQGIEFALTDTKSAALSIWPQAPVSLTLCTIAGIQVEGGAAVTLDGCYFTGDFIQDGPACRVFQSVFFEVDFLCHGSGPSGLNEWIGNIFDTCGPFGGGNAESRYTFQMEQCRFVDAPGTAVQILFGTSRVQATTIDDSVGSAIAVTNALAYIVSVDGVGNGGLGCDAQDNSTVLATAPTVTGASGDIRVGDIDPADWTDLPLTDLSKLVHARLLGI